MRVEEFLRGPEAAHENLRVIQSAIDHLSQQGGGRVIVSPGLWKTACIHLRSRIELHLEEGAEVRFSQNPADYLPVVLTQRAGIRIYNYSPFVYAFRCEDIAITGHGVLNGQGHTWWPWKFRQPGMKTILVDIPEQGIPLEERRFGTRESGVRPVFCQPLESERVLIEGVRFVNSPSWTIQPVACREVTVRYVTVCNPPSRLSHNTDGINPDSCRNVLIDHCQISTGDDAICLKSGLGPEAWRADQVLENVTISNCQIGSGHGGLTIGSEMSGGVRNIRVQNCVIDGASIGIRIKSKPGRGGFIDGVLFEEIRMRRILSHAVDCNLAYDGNREESLNLEDLRDVPRVENITLRDIECRTVPHGLSLAGLKGHPLRNITLKNISIASANGACVREVENLQSTEIHIHSAAPVQPDAFASPLSWSPRSPLVVEDILSPEIPFPAGLRPLGGRCAVPIPNRSGTSQPLLLRWRDHKIPSGTPLLRVTVAVDHRCEQDVEVANAVSGECYGVVPVRYGCPGQVLELPIPPGAVEAVLRDGLSLFLRNDAPPLWIVAPGPNAPDPVLPHLWFDQPAQGWKPFFSLLASAGTLQPCDWMEICVLDGLADLASIGKFEAFQAVKHHLTTFFDPILGQRENIYGQPNDQEPGGPETCGPFAILAMLNRSHPALALANLGFEEHFCRQTGSVGARVVAETSYNVAYPMMAMAVWAGQDQWYERALHQLEVNRRYLTGPDELWLRCCPRSGEKTFPNWSRGVAWYLLGLVRTLALIPDHERPSSLLEEANRVASWAIKYQLPGGLWPCFLKEPATVPDTSGSAGIGAGMAFGIGRGIIDPALLPSAMAVRDGLLPHLSSDGWLRGVSQSNKKEAAGRDLQRSAYRVIAPWGMGLCGQLLAALHPCGKNPVNSGLPAPVPAFSGGSSQNAG